jgi:two-component system cell cycle response regulator DivK
MPHKVLIIESDALQRALLLAALKPENYELLIVENGVHGVEVAQREQPQLILMEVMLPGISGYEATRRLKANPATQHIPIIAMGATVEPAERDRALDAGCDGYLAKPIDTRALPQQVRLFLHWPYRSP